MIYDFPTFFDKVRPLFGGKLAESQVKGMEAILLATPVNWSDEFLAYALATTKRETGDTMLPIKEWGGDAYYKKMYDINGDRPGKAKELGNTTPGDGVKYPGRGDVQLTGKSNYVKATTKLRAMGYDVDFVKNPDGVMIPKYAAIIMFRGMEEGWFTGKKLADFFNHSTNDPINARKIINGLDHANEIAAVYWKFLAALKAAKDAARVIKYVEPPAVAVNPVPETPTEPVTMSIVPVKLSFWQRFLQGFKGEA